MSIPLIFKRGYAVARALPRRPDPLKSSTKAETWQVAPGVTFTHRPPPTAPTPFSLTVAPASPLLVLGKRTPSTAPTSAEDVRLPPTTRNFETRERVTLTAEQVDEIRRIREETGENASVIAKQYGVSRFYIRAIAPLKPDVRHQKQSAVLEAEMKEREKWGYRKRLIRATRQKRKDYWSMGPTR